jgi:GNAT superfamily N-acetyltransferase
MEMATFIRDGSGRVRGGLYGWTWGGCCELQHLWVDEELRSNGLGGRMLAWAEEEARVRGCSQVVLFTHGSQSPGLYARRGYQVVGQVDGYPAGDTALWFQKLL